MNITIGNSQPKTAKEPDKQGKQPAPPKPVDKQESLIPGPVVQQMDELMRRIRILEERYSGLRKKTQLTEQNMLKDARDVFQEIRLVNDSISDLKSEVSELSEKMSKLSMEVENSVKKTEFNVMAKYLELWQPLDFVTRQDAQKIIDELKSNREDKRV
jgi:uncharacterized protein YoxC